jgi:hypothetical protein
MISTGLGEVLALAPCWLKFPAWALAWIIVQDACFPQNVTPTVFYKRRSGTGELRWRRTVRTKNLESRKKRER